MEEGGGRANDSEGKSSGNYALRYGSATQIQLLALFRFLFPTDLSPDSETFHFRASSAERKDITAVSMHVWVFRQGCQYMKLTYYCQGIHT